MAFGEVGEKNYGNDCNYTFHVLI